MTSRALITLPNGLRVVSVEMPHLHSAELALYLKVGGRNDPPGKGGLAHFLEHMLFRGTSDFPTSTDIETAFEDIGGSINASTDEECTCFFSRIHPAHVPRGVEILSSMMDAFASIISNNLNGVMKVLAALTIIVNLPAIVAAFYGMNVTLPGGSHPLAFLLVLGIAISLTAVATFVFYKRDWF